MEANGGTWHDGVWKGRRASRWKITKEATEMMDQVLIDNINNMVGENDILWHLGDFALPGKRDYINKCTEYRKRIKCKNVNLIIGNHDKPEKIYHLFQENYDYHNLRLDHLPMIALFHYPILAWNKHHRGAIHLYGHEHAGIEDWFDQLLPGRKCMDVGVDNAYRLTGEYRPFSLEEILNYMKDKPGAAIGHHVPNADAPEED